MKLAKTIDNRYIFYCEGCAMCHSFDNRWNFNGDMEKPTFYPSLLVQMRNAIVNNIVANNYVCNSFVREGKIEYLNDCSHKLAGNTVELKDEQFWYEE
jgi:hypothetical protein